MQAPGPGLARPSGQPATEPVPRTRRLRRRSDGAKRRGPRPRWHCSAPTSRHCRFRARWLPWLTAAPSYRPGPPRPPFQRCCPWLRWCARDQGGTAADCRCSAPPRRNESETASSACSIGASRRRARPTRQAGPQGEIWHPKAQAPPLRRRWRCVARPRPLESQGNGACAGPCSPRTRAPTAPLALRCPTAAGASSVVCDRRRRASSRWRH